MHAQVLYILISTHYVLLCIVYVYKIGSIPSINKTTLQLSYSDDLDQKRKGVMKYVISGPNSSVTLGVIWKVTIQSETYYISQVYGIVCSTYIQYRL